MEQKSLFPFSYEIEIIGTRVDDKCPHCGENRVTDGIHRRLTFVCGASRQGKDVTPCQPDRWSSFIRAKK